VYALELSLVPIRNVTVSSTENVEDPANLVANRQVRRGAVAEDAVAALICHTGSNSLERGPVTAELPDSFI